MSMPGGKYLLCNVIYSQCRDRLELEYKEM
jgi:hypothetical protein